MSPRNFSVTSYNGYSWFIDADPEHAPFVIHSPDGSQKPYDPFSSRVHEYTQAVLGEEQCSMDDWLRLEDGDRRSRLNARREGTKSEEGVRRSLSHILIPEALHRRPESPTSNSQASAPY